MLTSSETTFFELFGYLHIPGVLRDDIRWITAEFEAAFADHPEIVHTGRERTAFPSPTFIAVRPRLATLLEHPSVAAICTALLGDGYGFHTSDGNLYAGDTHWHADAFHQWPEKTTARHLKMAFYLDALDADSGALRVIPGSHHAGDRFCTRLQQQLPAWVPDRTLAIDGAAVPCVALACRPGDLVCFDHRIMHAAYGGLPRRRMFTMNWIEGARTAAMHDAIAACFRFGRDQGIDWEAYRGAWIDEAPPARAAVLAQLRTFGPACMRAPRAVA